MPESQNQQNVVARTRNYARAHDVARRLAGACQRTFKVQPYDARTWEIVPQRRDVDQRTINTYRQIAEGFVRLHTPKEN